MLPKVKIEVANGEMIARRIFYLIKRIDPSQCNRFVFDISLELATKIKKANRFEEVRDELIKFVLEYSDKDLPEKVKILQEKWDKENDSYFIQLQNFFNFDMSNNIFTGYSTNLMVGNYGDKNDFVIRTEDDNFDRALFIIKEEILHLVYWDFWRKIFNSKEKNPSQTNKKEGRLFSNWEISEIIPDYFFGFNEDSPRAKSYPWILNARKILDPIWQSKKNFKDFLIIVHNLTKSSIKNKL